MSDPKRLFQMDDELGGLLRAGKSEVPSDAHIGALATKLGELGLFDGGFDGGGGGAPGGDGGAAALKGGATAIKSSAAGAAAAKSGLALKVLSGVALATALGGGAVVATRSPAPVVVPSAGLVAHTATSALSSSSSIATPSVAPLVLDDPFPSAIPSAKAVKVAPSTSVSGESEVKMLERAQDALRARPAEALVIADDHARRYPGGMLAQEREVIAIEALARTGRAAEARTRATRFEQRFPGSAQIPRVRSLVGIAP